MTSARVMACPTRKVQLLRWPSRTISRQSRSARPLAAAAPSNCQSSAARGKAHARAALSTPAAQSTQLSICARVVSAHSKPPRYNVQSSVSLLDYTACSPIFTEEVKEHVIGGSAGIAICVTFSTMI